MSAESGKDLLAEALYVAAKRAIGDAGLDIKKLPPHRRQPVMDAILLSAKYAIEAARAPAPTPKEPTP